jgi:hypothetical protein
MVELMKKGGPKAAKHHIVIVPKESITKEVAVTVQGDIKKGKKRNYHHSQLRKEESKVLVTIECGYK